MTKTTDLASSDCVIGDRKTAQKHHSLFGNNKNAQQIRETNELLFTSHDFQLAGFGYTTYSKIRGSADCHTKFTTIKMTTPATFGNAISQGRKQKKMSQKDLAAQIKREDGVAISAQYLNDIEHDRRSPSSDLMVQQFASILKLDENYLYYLAGKIPAELVKANLSPEQVQRIMVAFRRTIK